jgi:hypothetical protein
MTSLSVTNIGIDVSSRSTSSYITPLVNDSNGNNRRCDIKVIENYDSDLVLNINDFLENIDTPQDRQSEVVEGEEAEGGREKKVDAFKSKEIGDKTVNGMAQRQDVSQGSSQMINTQKQPVFPSLSDALYARNQQKAGSQPAGIHTPSDTNICNPGTNVRDPDTVIQLNLQIEDNKNVKHPIRKKEEKTKETAVRKKRSVD